MTLDASIQERLLRGLCRIYGQDGVSWLPRVVQLLERYQHLGGVSRATRWDERDVVLITYGDQIRQDDCTPLASLRRFLMDYQLVDVFSTVHVLPFFPYTSDDGFSVIDYRAVDPALGNWQDIGELCEQVDLVFDLVLNHVSRQSAWFQGYISGDPRYADYFIEMDPAVDLSAVTRPRSLPLLTPVQTPAGERHVWTTFSGDQVDLNYANPAVLLDVLDVLLFYIQQGARFIRLDAVAYLWKEAGSCSIHLPQAHAVVKLMRDVVELLAPDVVLLTETNVPHAENISYFGEGDEAHMVYQFSLPPLLADALLQHDARALGDWLSGLEAAGAGTTFFNFTASHDGLGVRPLEGLLSAPRREQLVQAARQRGGLVSTKRNPDGSDAPYELNITYLDLLSESAGGTAQIQTRRFLASQAITLALRGIPGVYFHSLVGSHNDRTAARASGIARRINRRKFERTELDRLLLSEDSLQHHVFFAYRKLLAVRIAQPAFHPEAAQTVLASSHSELLAFLRTSLDATEQILVLANVSDRTLAVDLSPWNHLSLGRDLLTGISPTLDTCQLGPYQVAWLTAAGA